MDWRFRLAIIKEGGISNELIDALAEHIKKRIDEGNDMENEITEKTKALAELVSARAKGY